MSYGYYEHRLKQITDLLATGLETVAPEEAQELKKEREKILYELRHTESLPKTYGSGK